MFRNAEVEHLDCTVGRHHHVRRLQIAVHDFRGVRTSHRVGDLRRVAKRLAERHPSATPTGKRLSFDLHRDEIGSIVFANVVHRNDVGMIERRCGAGFEPEATPLLVATEHAGGHDFQRDVPAEPRVACPIHVAHAACSKERDDFVGAETGPGGKINVRARRL